MKRVQLITDGACIGNPGPGGWACILRYNGHTRELFGLRARTPPTTAWSYRAAIEGLRALQRAVPGGGGHRFRVPQERHHHLDPRLETKRMEDRI